MARRGFTLLNRVPSGKFNRVKMDIANQFPEIDVFLADDGFIAVLKKLPVPLIPSIEIDHIPCQKPSHQGRKAAIS